MARPDRGPGDPPPPPGLSASSTRSQLRYRLLVDDRSDLASVRAIAGDVIVTDIDGRSALQAGAFRERWRAEQLVTDLQAAGVMAWIVEVD